jgi:hypothetical protein
VYALVASEMASATLVVKDEVCELLQELYFTLRAWMRELEAGSARADKCSLLCVRTHGSDTVGGYTYATTLL